MITKLKLALMSEELDEFSELANELESAIAAGYLNSLSYDELIELQALYKQTISTLQRLKHKDLERIKKLKNSLQYIN